MGQHRVAAAFRVSGVIFLSLFLTALAGCEAGMVADGFGSLLHKEEAPPATTAQADDAKCKQSGLKAGTAVYDDCRRKLAHARGEQTAAELNTDAEH
jgi:hypothetical protein